MKKLKKQKESGITLIALVVTIVVLIILAVISINLTLSEEGIIKKAEEGKQIYEGAQQNEIGALDSLRDQVGEALGEAKKLATLTEIQDDKVEAVDTLGNKVVVPKGFKVVNEEDTVQEGIIIEDGIGNQYVWVPVSSTKRGNTETPIIIEKDGVKEEVNIILGRYTFANSSAEVPGKESLVQAGEEYASPDDYAIETRIKELNDGTQLSSWSKGNDATNTAFKDLKGFVESVESNKGYYIARFEASYGGGTTTPGTYSTSTNEDGDTVVNIIITDQKLCSVESVANSTSAMDYTKTGTLWNCITQGDAAKVCRNMYTDNNTVESDLMNSYAWDTAIVFIQKCSDNSNYANANCDAVALKDTGETGDVECNIYDMAGNLFEWTTENYNFSSEYFGPCVSRGGVFESSGSTTCYRMGYYATLKEYYNGFRPLLYNV